MKFLQSHIVLMFLYAVATAVFFTFLWKQEKHERIRFFFVVFSSLFLGGIGSNRAVFPIAGFRGQGLFLIFSVGHTGHPVNLSGDPLRQLWQKTGGSD